ncbi:MAG: SURF1 family protein [Candidatus Promineifilaceae bacterium]|jgi:surfeit locus 1 family protein
MSFLKTIFSRRWWWVTILVLIVMLVLARLGVWQLDRLQQRRAANAQIAAVLDAAPINLNEADIPEDYEEWENRLAAGSGIFDYDQQVLLKLQNWGYRAGVNLITPLVLEDGQTAVLVDRGWIPDTEIAPEAITAFNIPGQVTIDGYIALSQELSREPAATPEGPQSEIFRVDIPALQAQIPYKLLPFYVVQSPQDENEQLPFRLKRQTELSEGNHLSYAVQWFIFSIGLGVAYLVFVYRNSQQDE